MKRILLATTLLAVGAAGTGISIAGTADGQGAQKRGLFVTDESNGGCKESGTNSPGSPNGFAILNAPGKAGSIEKIVGEVSLKNAAPNGMWTVELAIDGTCTPQAGVLTTNGQGNGNFHISSPFDTGSQYWVVLRAASGDSYATAHVALR